MRVFFLLLSSVFLALTVNAQSTAKCYPTHWWAGMKWNKVQLMLHADSGFSFTDKFTLNINYPGIKV